MVLFHSSVGQTRTQPFGWGSSYLSKSGLFSDIIIREPKSSVTGVDQGAIREGKWPAGVHPTWQKGKKSHSKRAPRQIDATSGGKTKNYYLQPHRYPWSLLRRSSLHWLKFPLKLNITPRSTIPRFWLLYLKFTLSLFTYLLPNTVILVLSLFSLSFQSLQELKQVI